MTRRPEGSPGVDGTASPHWSLGESFLSLLPSLPRVSCSHGAATKVVGNREQPGWQGKPQGLFLAASERKCLSSLQPSVFLTYVQVPCYQIPQLGFPTVAKGVKVGKTAEFPCKRLGRCLDTQCLIKAAPTASVIYRPLPGETPHSSKVHDLKHHRGKCEFQARHPSLGCARVYVWLWSCKASGREASKQAPDPCFRLSIPAPTGSLPPSEIASVLYLGHSHSRGNWQGAGCSSDLFEGTPLIRGTDLEGSYEAQV